MRVRRVAAGLAVVAALAAALPSPASAAPTTAPTPTTSTTAGPVLALGDSVPFGFTPNLPVPSPPRLYVGYPQILAARTGIPVTDLACPGQTVTGMIRPTGDDNGCLPYRSVAALHAPYTATQLGAAKGWLRQHPRTRAVTLQVGVNDLFLCQKTSPTGCLDPVETVAVLDGVRADLDTVLAGLREVYAGPVLLVGYYSTDYSSPTVTFGASLLRDLYLQAAAAHPGVRVVDGFTAFRAAAEPFDGSLCAAGLLVVRPDGTCDIHPSRRGAGLYATLVAKALAR